MSVVKSEQFVGTKYVQHYSHLTVPTSNITITEGCIVSCNIRTPCNPSLGYMIVHHIYSVDSEFFCTVEWLYNRAEILHAFGPIMHVREIGTSYLRSNHWQHGISVSVIHGIADPVLFASVFLDCDRRYICGLQYIQQCPPPEYGRTRNKRKRNNEEEAIAPILINIYINCSIASSSNKEPTTVPR